MGNEREAVKVRGRCTAELAVDFRALESFVQHLAGVSSLTCGPDVAKPPQSASKVLGGFDLFVSLAGLIDPAKEKGRLDKQLAEKRKLLAGRQAKLAREDFLVRAPAELVKQERNSVSQ